MSRRSSLLRHLALLSLVLTFGTGLRAAAPSDSIGALLQRADSLLAVANEKAAIVAAIRANEPDGKYTYTADGVTYVVSAMPALPAPVDNLPPATVVNNPSVPHVYQKAHFAWGASAGASIDCCGQDMSSLDFDARFGFRYRWIRFLGIGAAAKIMVSNSCRSYPLFVELHTNFRNNPSLFFWAIRGGVSLNYLEHNHQQANPYGFTGLGVRLAYSSKFTSYVLLGYTILQRKRIVGAEMTHDFTDLHYASFKLGVTF